MSLGIERVQVLGVMLLSRRMWTARLIFLTGGERTTDCITDYAFLAQAIEKLLSDKKSAILYPRTITMM